MVPVDSAPPDSPDEIRRRIGILEDEVRAFAAAGTAEARAGLAALRRRWLEGRESVLTSWFAHLKRLPDAEGRAAFGSALNEGKKSLDVAVSEAIARLDATKIEAASGASGVLDPTFPGPRARIGSLHPLTIVRAEVERVFAALGFEVVEGPEVEDEAHNFDGLNIPPDHPARAPSENFRLPGGLLLRSQTSPGQVRALESRSPPLRVLVPGRVYRPDTVDARHLYAFHQVEGLCVGRGVSMADLKGTLGAFARGFYGPSVDTRFRPSYFPFTEPSAEMDVTCPACTGAGGACSTCGGEGWMELLGCGMVHPEVLRRAGHDPEKWTGFAFGMGIERAAMRRWGIADIRALVENDVRFLEQFP